MSPGRRRFSPGKTFCLLMSARRTVALIRAAICGPQPSPMPGAMRHVRTSSTCDLGEIVDPFVYELDRPHCRRTRDPLELFRAQSGAEISGGSGVQVPYGLFRTQHSGISAEHGRARSADMDLHGLSEFTTPEGGATRFPRLGKAVSSKRGHGRYLEQSEPGRKRQPALRCITA